MTNSSEAEILESRDRLGDRMKERYEDRTRFMLVRGAYTIIRIDGKAFHSYTKDLGRPFDAQFMADMDATAKALCEGIQGTKMAFVQSDEISLVLTDFETPQTDAWFGGNVQKIASISASMATAKFNAFRHGHEAMFDSRCFVIPSINEVVNYLIWRQQDATRNSIQAAAQSMFDPEQLHGLDCNQLQERMFSEKGVNWNDYPAGFKRGRAVITQLVLFDPKKFIHKETGEIMTSSPYDRQIWKICEPPIFTQDQEYVKQNLLELRTA